jgi:Na+-transporting methylmalonyl-CoA/oxaloacetate decarboxylase gamma subunit
MGLGWWVLIILTILIVGIVGVVKFTWRTGKKGVNKAKDWRESRKADKQ